MNVVKYYRVTSRDDGSQTLHVELVRLHKRSARGIAEADREMAKRGFTRKRPKAMKPHVRYKDLPKRPEWREPESQLATSQTTEPASRT